MDTKIYCISLKKRTDRRKHITEMMAKHGLEFEFFDAIENKNGTLGCFDSHVEVLKLAREKGLDKVMIMEDDCEFIRDFELPEFPDNWEMLFLGGAVNMIYDRYNKDWYQVSTWYAHCYLVKSSLFDELIETAERLRGKKAIDEVYCEDIHYQHYTYIIYPLLAQQYDNYSDIEQKRMDRTGKISNYMKTLENFCKMPKGIDAVYCINLEHREDKKNHMMSVVNKSGISIRFFTAKLHEKPARGCLESHVSVLKDVKRRRLRNVLILEDDVEIVRDLNTIEYPTEWDMLYLGGNVQEQIDDPANTDSIKRIRSWSTYAYIVNETMFDKLIEDLPNTEKEIDRYYIENIHPNYKCYMTFPNMVVPIEGDTYSDIMGKTMNYDFLREGVEPSKKETISELNIKMIDNADDLPYISIVTPTYNRRKTIRLAIANFLRFNYPPEKMEWIVVSDGPDDIIDCFPKDERIRYYHFGSSEVQALYDKFIANIMKNRVKRKNIHKYLAKKVRKEHLGGMFYKNRIPIGMKRNIATAYAKHDIVLHMDDDDYYYPESVRYRVSALLGSEKDMVCSTAIPNFDVSKYISSINCPPYDLSFEKRVSEGSMCYKKSYWNHRKFNNQDIGGEGEMFVRGNQEKCMELDWRDPVIVSLLHDSNTSARRDGVKAEDSNGWHFGQIDDNMFLMITSLGS